MHVCMYVCTYIRCNTYTDRDDVRCWHLLTYICARTHTHSYKYTLTYTFPWPHCYHPWLFGGSPCFRRRPQSSESGPCWPRTWFVGRSNWGVSSNRNGSKPLVFHMDGWWILSYTTTIYFGVNGRDSHVGFFDNNRYFLNSQFLNIVRNYLYILLLLSIFYDL